MISVPRYIQKSKGASDINVFQIISQVIGIILFIAVIAIGQMKNIKLIFVCELGCNTLSFLNYFILSGSSVLIAAELLAEGRFAEAGVSILNGEIAGAAQCLVALIQALVSYILTRKGKKFPIWLTAVFLVLYVAVFIPTYTNLKDVLPLAACLLYCLAMAQKTSAGYRRLITPNAIIWVIYDIMMGAYTTAITHGFMFVSNVIGIIRHDIKRKPE